MSVQANWCASITFRDAKGQTRKITICWETIGADQSHVYGAFFGATAATVPLFQALSNAHVQSQDDPVPVAPNQFRGYTYGAAAEYQSVAQQAVLSYTLCDETGAPQAGVGRVTIPAPKLSIFLADGITVDPTNADVVAFNAQILATAYPVPLNGAGMATKDGLLFNNMIGGVFVGKKISRKMTKFTYNPELTVRGI